MKSRKRLIGLVALLALCAILGFAADQYIFSTPYEISGTLEIPVTQTTKPYYLTSVILQFPAASAANTFTVAYVRGDVTNTLLSATATNVASVVYYFPNRVYYKGGDTLQFSNTDSTTATLTLNAEF